MRTFEVHLGGRRVGTIAETRQGARFGYSPDIYETCPGVPVLSLALPAKRRPFSESKTHNWFEGLLPEGDRKERACRKFGLKPHDWMGLLGEIGWECAGAVQVFPEGASCEHGDSYEHVEPADLVNKLTDAYLGQPAAESSVVRMSLGGYQDKLCVRMPALSNGGGFVRPEGIRLPKGDAPSTHILKPEPSRYVGLAESEAWAMTVARCAARCAKVALLQLDGSPDTLVVERYDRRITRDDTVIRLHQEDACQALNLPVEEKYAHESTAKGDDPTYAGIASLLDRYSVNAEEEKIELLRQLTVSMALGNWDAHAKNISFLYLKHSLPIVAPLYDVVPIAEIEPRTTLLSLRVNGSLVPDSVDGPALREEAKSWGLSAGKACETIECCLEALVEGFEDAGSFYPEAAKRHEEAARHRIEHLRVK